MIPLKKATLSSIGQKFVMALTGLALFGFVVVHLTGNLTLYSQDSATFNQYAKFLHDLGPLLTIAELGLLAFFAFHIMTGVRLTYQAFQARGNTRYQHSTRTKGGPSHNSVASRNMIITGSVLGFYVLVHVLQFRFMLFDDASQFETTIDGEQARDLYGLVAHTFADPLWVAFYVGAMGFLGFHLRHGFWSAFQSLGALNPRLERPMVALGLVLAVVLAVGFLGIPIYMFIMQSVGA
jgi:succinate dehydrogenase / fumarate reductase cytochrome b subunit